MLPVKYGKTAEKIRSYISENGLAEGERLPTQTELAEICGCSRSCLNKALQTLEQSGVVLRRQGKGIFAGSGRRERKLRNIAVLLPDFQSLIPNETDNFGLEIFLGIEKGLRSRGLGCQLMRPTLQSAYAIGEQLQDLHVDGIIADRNYPDKFLERLSVCGLPVILSGRRAYRWCAGCVQPDFSGAIQLILHRLYELGKRRVSFYYPNGWMSCREFAADTTDLPGLKFRAEDYLNGRTYDSNDHNDIYRQVRKDIEGKVLPEVIIGHSDWCAIRIIEELERQKIPIPEKAEVIGMLGLPLGEKHGITSMRIEAAEIGEQAVDLLCRLNGKIPDFPIQAVVPMVPVERKSCKLK